MYEIRGKQCRNMGAASMANYAVPVRYSGPCRLAVVLVGDGETLLALAAGPTQRRPMVQGNDLGPSGDVRRCGMERRRGAGGGEGTGWSMVAR